MLLSCVCLFADYNQDLKLRRELDCIAGFLEYQDSSIANKYFTGADYLLFLKTGFFYANEMNIVEEAQDYFDEFCEKVLEYDQSSPKKLTYHDFLTWTHDYVVKNKGKFLKPKQ